MRCLNCSAELSPGTRFCMRCGAPVPSVVTCPHCGAAQPAGYERCAQCGRSAESPVACAGCGALLPEGVKFCIRCGRAVVPVAAPVAAAPPAAAPLRPTPPASAPPASAPPASAPPASAPPAPPVVRAKRPRRRAPWIAIGLLALAALAAVGFWRFGLPGLRDLASTAAAPTTAAGTSAAAPSVAADAPTAAPTVPSALAAIPAQTATTTADAPVTLSANLAQAALPAGALPAGVTISLREADELLAALDLAPPPALTFLGPPIDVSADGGHTRLDEPVTLAWTLPAAMVTPEEWQGNDIWIAYWDGAAWAYLPPTHSDPETGRVAFEAYHFSLLGAGKIDLEQRIEQWTHSAAISKHIQENVVDAAVDAAVAQAVGHILKDKLKLADDGITSKILTSLATDDAYRDLVDQYNSGDGAAFAQTLAVFAGQKIAENVDESVLSTALGALAGDTGVGMATAAANAAGYLVEGQYRDAARILGEQIADQFFMTTVAKGAVEVVQYQIDTWKNAEIEAAYTAYKNGSDSYFWGYNNDPNDFDAVWNQMRGIAVRLQSEAVEREAAQRAELGLPPLTDAQANALRDKVRSDLRQQFEDRRTAEEAIAAREAQIALLIAAMRDAKLLERFSFGYDPDELTVEQRLDQLLGLADRILRDTGRNGWNSGVFSGRETLSTGDMAILMQSLLLNDGGREYARLLREKFGIELLLVTAEQLAGTWLFVPQEILSNDIVCTYDNPEDSVDVAALPQLLNLGSMLGEFTADADGLGLSWYPVSDRIPAELAGAIDVRGAVLPSPQRVRAQVGMTIAPPAEGQTGPLRVQLKPLQPDRQPAALLGVGALAALLPLTRGIRPGRRRLALLAGLLLLAGCFGLSLSVNITGDFTFDQFEDVGGTQSLAINMDGLEDLSPVTPPAWRLTGVGTYDVNFELIATIEQEDGTTRTEASRCQGVLRQRVQALVYTGGVTINWDEE